MTTLDDAIEALRRARLALAACEDTVNALSKLVADLSRAQTDREVIRDLLRNEP